MIKSTLIILLVLTYTNYVIAEENIKTNTKPHQIKFGYNLQHNNQSNINEDSLELQYFYTDVKNELEMDTNYNKKDNTNSNTSLTELYDIELQNKFIRHTHIYYLIYNRYRDDKFADFRRELTNSIGIGYLNDIDSTLNITTDLSIGRRDSHLHSVEFLYRTSITVKKQISKMSKIKTSFSRLDTDSSYLNKTKLEITFDITDFTSIAVSYNNDTGNDYSIKRTRISIGYKF